MAGVNVSRSSIARQMSRALEGAEVVGKNREGEICVWCGGYSFNVYDAARDWEESKHFTSGRLAGDISGEEAQLAAKERMLSEGFTPIDSR